MCDIQYIFCDNIVSVVVNFPLKSSCNRVTIRAIFPRSILARISILPKIGYCGHRFLMFLKRSRGTSNQRNIEILAKTRLGKMARMVVMMCDLTLSSRLYHQITQSARTLIY